MFGKYQGDGDTVVADLAPVAPGWVDRKSIAVTKENIERITSGVYGYEVISAKADGNAACVVLRLAWTDKKGPTGRTHPSTYGSMMVAAEIFTKSTRGRNLVSERAQ